MAREGYNWERKNEKKILTEIQVRVPYAFATARQGCTIPRYPGRFVSKGGRYPRDTAKSVVTARLPPCTGHYNLLYVNTCGPVMHITLLSGSPGFQAVWLEGPEY